MKPLKFGVVSTARIARNYVIPAMKAVAECEVVALSSRDQSRGDAVAKELGIPRVYNSLEAMLCDSDVEAVYIASPNHMHVRHSVTAARAGRHVLCEKPVGLNAAEAATLAQVERETGVVVSEAFMVRHQPRWKAARDIVRSGRLGRVRQIFATYSVMIPDLADIRFDRASGGGALGDLAVYPITAARYFFEAEPLAATATFEPLAGGDVEIAVAGLLEFSGSRSLLFSAALRQAWSQWIRVIGDGGSLEIPLSIWTPMDRETRLIIHDREDRYADRPEILHFPQTNQYEAEVRAFANAVRGMETDTWRMQDAVASMSVVDAIRQSAHTRQRVGIPVSAE